MGCGRGWRVRHRPSTSRAAWPRHPAKPPSRGGVTGASPVAWGWYSSTVTTALRQRSIRTLAWLGDAEFECDVRRRIALRGDYPTGRLDRVRAAVTKAETQAEMLSAIESELTDDETAVVRRARNLRTTRAARSVAAYRAATALEALVAFWCTGEAAPSRRLADVLGPVIERAIDEELARPEPKRG
ncbi:MAG: hypothetical protein B7733_13305 [Myxococcales bacterium FL481]|nr:MAG: hypothetical protein B7733_13305 [Myxococcales bacterium FL481]